ncbi:heme ABC transporter ATP-binding protein [Nocardioides sp. 616]|uniref:heme ABC transporter ATP-binding protein n=1 Tax=Nocardioides sp. 616 TaxID=2268090 RepID=UPI001F05601D|nr:heme ABC transporter ATP-binding protein [Nocardioides sp. 616]
MKDVAALRAAGVCVDIDGCRILHDVSLEVRCGELVALVGPNGAGKSTLLAVLAGDRQPDSGAVELGGRPIAAQSVADLARQRAVLQQKHTLAFGFRVREVVEMGRAVWRRTPRADQDDASVEAAMAIADVTHLAARVVPTLSGGEQARVAYARLLAQEVEVHLLDEPTAALDIRHQEALLSQARSSAQAGAAVVVVLHDLSLAAAWADRVCVLAGGEVRAVGTPAEVITSALLSEVYEHPVEVLQHHGQPLVVPVRNRPTAVHLQEDPCPVVV